VILSAEPAIAPAALTHFQTEMAALRRGRLHAAPAEPRIRTVSYDFAQLKEWFDSLLPLAVRTDVIMFDIDEVENRVYVGVEGDEAEVAVRRAAAGIGVPEDAIAVGRMVRPEPRHTVRDRRDVNLVGGYQMQFGPQSNQICTMAFNAMHDGEWVFVTNSHCTAIEWQVDGGTIMQPSWIAGNEIGFESHDRHVHHCLPFPNLIYCRGADAALIRHNLVRGIDQGRIAETPWSMGAPSSLLVVGTYDVVARVPGGGTAVGTVLDKTGRTSGSTFGQVTRSCIWIELYACQDESTVYSEQGDSGSPMYVWQGDGTVHLQGILWGGPPGDWNTTYSSRLGGIEADFGPLTNLCRPGFGC
jgi:hypothetical protein